MDPSEDDLKVACALPQGGQGVDQSPGISSAVDSSTAALPKSSSRVLRVEVNGSLHDWFDIEEMGDFVRSPTFADTLLENIARYFGVPVENQAIYDEDGLLTTSADFSRALQRVSPMLYIYDVNEMGPELKERTVEELAMINAGVEQSWRNFRMLSTRGRGPLANLGTLAPAAASSASAELGTVAEGNGANEAYMSPNLSQQVGQQPQQQEQQAYMSPMMSTQAYMSPNLGAQAGNSKQVMEPERAGDDIISSAAQANPGALASDDALLTAKAQVPVAVTAAVQAGQQAATPPAAVLPPMAGMNGGPQTALSKFGGATAPAGGQQQEAEAADGQGEQPAVQVYSLLAPAATPDPASKAGATPPSLRLSTGLDAAGISSAQTTARTILSASGVREDALTARSSGLRPGKNLSQMLAPQLSASSLRQPQPPHRGTAEGPLLQGMRSPPPPLPARSAALPLPAQSAAALASAGAGTAPAAYMLGTAQPSAMCWPALGTGLSAAASAAAPNAPTSLMQWGGLLQPGASEDLGLARMVSSNMLVSGSFERTQSPTRSVTPPPTITRSVTPTKSATALGYEPRVLNPRPPPAAVSPAPIGTRSSLVRMPSGSHIPYNPVCATERSHSPARAVTPTPITARSVTPVTQHRASDYLPQVAGPAASMRSVTPPPLVQQYSGRSTTPIRSQAAVGRPSVGGSTYATTPSQPLPGTGQLASVPA